MREDVRPCHPLHPPSHPSSGSSSSLFLSLCVPLQGIDMAFLSMDLSIAPTLTFISYPKSNATIPHPRLAMAMSSAVFTPLPIFSSLRCSAEPSSTGNGAASTTNFVKLPLSVSVSAAQPLSLSYGEPSSSSSASAMSVLHPGMEFVNVMLFKGSYNAQVC